MADLPMIYQRSLSSSDEESKASNRDVEELTLFWSNFLNSSSEQQRVS